MRTIYVIEIETKTSILSNKEYTEKMNGGVILTFLKMRFPNNPKIGIYRGKKHLKGTTKR